jgi:hypothetical protein
MGAQQSSTSPTSIIPSNVMTPDNDLSSIMLKNPANAAQIFDAMLNTKVYMRNKKTGHFWGWGFTTNINENAQILIYKSNSGGYILTETKPNYYALAYDTNASGSATGANPNNPDDPFIKWNIKNETLSPGVNGFTFKTWYHYGRPLKGAATLGERSFTGNNTDPLTLDMLWDIIILEPEKVCAKLDKTYAFSLCNKINPSTQLYKDMAKGYCVRKIGGKSALMTDQNCQTWCNNNPADCESTMLTYCNANPTATECQCVFADRQPDYLAFTAKYPMVSGSASCFTQACRGTNFATQLIPKSISTTRCPDLTNIQQTSNQTLNVATGATVINPTLTANQTATVVQPKQTATQQVVPKPTTQTTTSNPPSVVSDTTSRNILLFVLFIWFILVGVGLSYFWDDIFAAEPVVEQV